MNNFGPSFSSLRVAFAAIALAAAAPQIVHADIPGVTFVETIDPSPGIDVFGLQHLGLNRTTHKLYVAGIASDATRNYGLKVIDSTTFAVVAAVDLGRYPGDSNGFRPMSLDVDEGSGPAGDKVYIVGRTDTAPAVLRVVDGPSNTNLTGENNGDLFLPISFTGENSFNRMTVNSANHKVYVAKANGEIIVIDGPNRQILKTLNPNFGDFVIASPGTNKVFVVNHNGGGVINSADDTFAQLSLFFSATAATVDSAHARVYFVGKALNNSNAIFAVDAATGAIVGSKTLPAAPLSVAVDPGKNEVYVGSSTNLIVLDANDFSEKGGFARPAAKLACDPAVSAGLFSIEDYQVTLRQNVVYATNPENGTVADLAVGYLPFKTALNSRTRRVYVADDQTSEVLALDRNPNGGITRIPAPPTDSIVNNPAYLNGFQRDLAVSERLNRFYLPRRIRDHTTGTVNYFIDVFDGGTNQFLRSIALDPTLYKAERVAIDDTRRQLYVAATRKITNFNYEMLLLAYDADTEVLKSTISLGFTSAAGGAGLAANPVTGRVYYNNYGSPGTVVGMMIVDGNTNTKIGTVDGVAGEIAINRRTNKIYTVGGGNTLAVINGATDALETTFSIQNQNESTIAFDVDEVTNRVYVVQAAHLARIGRMTAYDANNNYQLLGQIDLPAKPVRITVASAARELFVTNDWDGVITVFQLAQPALADVFGNISTRALVGDGDSALIGGFIIHGPSSFTKKLMIRAVGPSLTPAGVSGALPDTTVEVHDGGGNVITNDDWKISDATNASQQAEIEATGIPPTSEQESALVLTLPAGRSVTAIVRGKNGAEGIGLVEVYDLDQTLPAKLVNISSRGRVGLGDNAMIAGVIILGSKPVNVLLRAIGPSLANSNVPNPLEDPVLELRDPNGGLVASNDDWREHEAEVAASLLAPTDSRESAILTRLYPANYTAIARGKDGHTGVALVEAYYLIVGQ
ncbi:MAG TPA: hypothetical protein VM940_14185 [Chthoniobacterales bacterium]|jgi:hypothetical protein|nr:hypothetical protein [Chthoniobacterales bacterium]